MSEEIRKILEAVARGEISPEEGEMLIKAMQEKEREESGSKGASSEREGNYILDENEIVEEDLVLSKKKAIIRGKIKGDLALINCETFFSGEVEGDLAVIGGKIEFDGGTVKGDLALIDAKDSGKAPVVEGDIARISNFFVGGILKMISPFIGNISVSSRKKKVEGKE
ncbi:conserved hypothetical protein [Thermotoga petrophila RKU-10]|uniref:YvlB/LiaX N-terminal domain-containing protein n=1 Tax=Thermotoga petrophila (strain ATCC BAA-489 / DSM 13996 / JCM 10882 / RKU-10) TaxID=590168 RepID=D2C7X8_THEP2|nr:hypothetical protein [Thermotoga petrophila]ADA67064.1 conserved hypothetical protein [Thermotoga petrophila RKU-10]